MRQPAMLANMNSCKLLFVSLLCSFLWYSCTCDSINIPQRHDEAISGPNTAPVLQEELLHNTVDENVNIELRETQKEEKIILSNLETKRQPIENSDVNVPKFTEKVRKMRRKDDNEIKRHVKQTDSDDSIIASNLAQEVQAGKTRLEEDGSVSSEQNNVQGNKHAEGPDKVMNIEILSSQPTIENTVSDSSSAGVDVQENIVSQNASPSPIDVTKKEESVPPSSMAESIEPTEQSQHPHSEAMPSFDEWKKMMLAEQEKGGHKMPPPGPPGKKVGGQKRRRNYASYECGAKIVASNTEAEGTSRILNELVDEYMLNPCQAKIWFVIELCESVQASQIELANFELFSSCPKDFAVYSSDNFPTRDWVPLGIFTAAEQRVLQSFQLKQEGYGKFIKIELQSYYGKEHYCPLSVVRIFGTSMVDEYEEMETLSNHPTLQEDELDRLDLPVEDKVPTNIFGSATDAVYNIVKKAAQVLVQHQTAEGESADSTVEQNISESEHCKLIDDECNKENDTRRAADSKESPNDFLISGTSIHRTLFHHLRHCEQCVKVSRPSYHSISEPQCRFFQAALGPVLFTSICDWFRDHHLITITQAPIIDIKGNVSGSSQKQTSPQPSVIRVIIDRNQSDPYTLQSSVDTKVTSHKSDSLVHETSDLPADFKKIGTTTTGLNIDSAIKPTKTLSTSEEGLHIDLRTTNTDASFVLQSEMENALSIKDHSVSEELLPLSRIDTNEILSPSLTSLPPVESIVSNETKVIPQNIEKIDDVVITEASTVTVITSTVDPSTEDFTEELRTGEDKFTDVKDSTIKLETVMVGGTSGQKESVFIRMNNRIKALELNMSLSSQYLQELSQRYRRQMEEMQRAFNRTIGTLNDTAKKAAERDLKQQEVIGNLQSQVANLTLVVDQLITERSTALRRMLELHVFLMVVEAIIMITIMSLCVRRISSKTLPQSQSAEQNVVALTSRKRRSSIDSSPAPSVPKIKKRSASEEVLSTGSELLIVEPPAIVPLPKVKKRNKKKKNNIERSLSNPSMSPTKGSTSLGKKKKKEASSAAGIIFSHTNAKNLTETEKLNHACENCNNESASNCSKKNYATIKESKRKNYSPLKNLTNGDLECDSMPVSQKSMAKEKEKFSFKKFLKFQKRESI